jgi:hypothetical protein
MYPTNDEIKKRINGFNGLYSLEKYGIKRKLYHYNRNNISFFFIKSNNFNFWVKEYYMNTADKVEILNNILANDKTINYKVSYDINRIEDIFNMHILNNYNNYYSVNNISLQHLLGINCESQIYHNSILHNIDITNDLNTFNTLQNNLNKTKKNTIKFLYNNYLMENETYNAITDIICDNYRFTCFDDSMTSVEKAYEKSNYIIRKILNLPQNTSLKNTSELILYKTVKDIFQNAIYQYKADWLKRQSLDIFIPNISVGIEYQGIQHYEPIDYFGGVSVLKKQQERDFIKKELCKENNVILIEWKYTEDITHENLIKKLENLNIKWN